MVPRLSDLQAQLRKGDGAVASRGQAKPSGLPKDGLKRPSPEDGSGGPPKKRPTGVGQTARVAIVKMPANQKAKGKSAVPGLSAKVASPGSATPPVGPDEAAVSTSAKSGMPVAFNKATIPQGPPAKRVAAPVRRPPVEDGSATTSASIEELINSIEASPPSVKKGHAEHLAEALGQTLPIEHINYFLRTLKSKIVERAQADGVQAHPTQAPKSAPKSAPKPAPPKSAPPKSAPRGEDAMPEPVPAATTPKSGAAPSLGKAVVKVPGLAKAALSKSAGMIAKAMAETTSPKASIAKAPPKRPDVPKSNPKPSPPASPPADMPDDALYQLVGELTEDPVVQDGLILEDRLNEVFRRLWDGAARKPKDWVAAWQAMGIPQDCQNEALQKLLNIAFVQTEDPDKAPLILAELVKGHKVKMRSVEEVFVSFGQNLDGILAINEEAWQVYAKFLVHVFPKAAAAGWGWSRVGWDWKGWWQFCERCIQSLEPSRSFDVIGLVLKLIQDKEGTDIHSNQVWMADDRLAKTLAKLCDLGGCELPEVAERLALLGVNAVEETM